MAEEYVSKEVFDARMDRMEAIMEKTLTEVRMEVSAAVNSMKEDNAQLRSEVKEDIAQLRSEVKADVAQLKEDITQLRTETRALDTRIDSVNTRIDSVQTSVYWGFALMGLILAFTTFAPAFLEFLKGLRRPFATFEDVERIVNAALRQVRLEGN